MSLENFFSPLWLSVELASITTAILFMIGLPFAWWLTHHRSLFKTMIEATVALPLILPPTVLGFYLLMGLSDQSGIGRAWFWLTHSHLVFSFQGLIIGSIIYSFPFVIQPLQQAFETMGRQPLETAAILGLSPWKRFFKIVLPLSRRGLLSAFILGFAHTLGEFGVVLMIGGNIPGKTQVISIYLYDQVEQLQYHQAYILSLILLITSFLMLFILYSVNRYYRGHNL